MICQSSGSQTFTSKVRLVAFFDAHKAAGGQDSMFLPCVQKGERPAATAASALSFVSTETHMPLGHDELQRTSETQLCLATL